MKDIRDFLHAIILNPGKEIGENEVEIAKFLNGDIPYIIVAAGPLQKQPHTNLYRIVLRLVYGARPEFAVHAQLWFDNPAATMQGLYTQVPPGKCSFEQGDYFPWTEFHKATQRFGERLAKDAERHYATVYREAAQEAVAAS